MSTIYLGLGSNVGHREANLQRAIDLLGERVKISRASAIYQTEPVGYADQPWFLNMVCEGETLLDPFELLAFVKGIEARMGREPSFPNGPRVIDVDILFYDDRIVGTDYLAIPHPRIAERRFVLVPLAEIAPSFVHPASGKAVSELLSGLTDSQADSQDVRKWGYVPSFRPATL